MTYLLVVWGVDSWLGEDTIKDETDGNTTWDTDKSSLFISTFLRYLIRRHTMAEYPPFLSP